MESRVDQRILNYLRMRSAFSVYLLGIFFFYTVVTAHGKSFDEAEVKAVFLYNLAKFVEWPGKRQTSRENFVIGVLGNDPIIEKLERVVWGEVYKGKKIAIHSITQIQDISWQELDVLFVARNFLENIHTIAGKSHLFGVLTIGDSRDFCQKGGNINLLQENRRVRIEVNLNELRRSGFAVSAQVLKLARIISTRKEEQE